MLRVVVVQFGARRERCSAFPSWWHCWHACAVERALQRWRVMLLAVRGIVGVYVQWNWRCSADMSCCLPCVVALLVPVYCGTCAAALVCRVDRRASWLQCQLQIALLVEVFPMHRPRWLP